MHRLAILAVVLTLTVVSAVSALSAGKTSGAPAEHSAPPPGNFTMAKARAFAEFPLYDVGEQFQGWNKTAVIRRVDGPQPGISARANFVSFLYGECDAQTSCAPPLEIQVWPACVRNPSSYDLAPQELGAREALSIRGATAFLYEGGTRLELSTAISTVVLFANSREDVIRAANELRGVNLTVGLTDRLPAPAVGALEGGLRCSGT